MAPRNRIGIFLPLYNGRKCSIQGVPKLGMEWNEIMQEKLVFRNSQKLVVRTSKVIFSDTILTNFWLPRFEKVIQNENFLFQQTELRACIFLRNALEQNSESLHTPRNEILSCFLFHEMVWN